MQSPSPSRPASASQSRRAPTGSRPAFGLPAPVTAAVYADRPGSGLAGGATAVETKRTPPADQGSRTRAASANHPRRPEPSRRCHRTRPTCAPTGPRDCPRPAATREPAGRTPANAWRLCPARSPGARLGGPGGHRRRSAALLLGRADIPVQSSFTGGFLITHTQNNPIPSAVIVTSSASIEAASRRPYRCLSWSTGLT